MIYYVQFHFVIFFVFANLYSSLQVVGSFLNSRRRWIGIFLVFLIVGLAVSSVLARPAYSATDIGQLVTSKFWLELFAQIILAIAGWFIKLTVFILSFVITLAGYNGYLDSTAVNVGWVMVRDITNMGFVVILLLIAFGTILGLEQYEWKKLLGKFIFAAILVNFSRTICGLIIDVAQVVMTTFVNGIAATAGGNLINAFQLNRILELSDGVVPSDLTPAAQFIAAVGGITFAAMVMGVMFVFLYMLLARMVVLWVLIVLSPLAFVLSVLPNTESYAGKWWSEFTSNVITGPVLLFFVWLSFVTLGGGNISSDIADHSTSPTRIDGATSGADSVGTKDQSAGVSAIMTWSKMASFAIAIGMLMVGAKAAGELGGAGADAVGSAIDFGKKVGSYASGLTAARWAGNKAADAGLSAAKWGLMNAPLVGGNNWVNMGRTIKGMAQTGLGIIAHKRNAAVVNAEGWADKKGGLGGALASVLVSAYKRIPLFGETAGRKAKRAEDWEKAAENQAKVVEETYSTSKGWGGRAKLYTGVMAHAAEKQAEKKKDKKYKAREQKFIDDHNATFHGFEEGAISAQAEAENIEKNLHRQEAIAVARKRADQLRAQGKNAEAAAVIKHAYNSQFEEDQKAFADLGQNEKVNEAIKIARETADLDSLGDALTEAQQAKLKNLRRSAAQLIAASAKDGQETYATVMRAMLQEIRGNADMSAESSGQDILQAITGRSHITNSAEFDAAHELLNDSNTFRDNNEGQAVLSLLADATKGLAMKGENRAAGAVEELPADRVVLEASHIAPSAGASTAFRLFNQHAPNRIVRSDGTTTAAALKRGTEGYFAPRADLKQAEYIQGFGTTDGNNHATSLNVGLLFERMSKFKDPRDVSSGFSSAFSDSTKRENITGAAEGHVVTLLTDLRNHYDRAGKIEVYRQIRDTVFSEWKNVAGVPQD